MARVKLELEIEQLKVTDITKDIPLKNNVIDVYLKISLSKIIPNFDKKVDEINLYSNNFKRTAEIANVPKREYTAFLFWLLPKDIVNQIGREKTKDIKNDDFVKNLLLKRYKLNPENLRRLFYSHKNNERSWRNYTHELKRYFEEWLSELKISTFKGLRELIVSNKIKFRVNDMIKEHFIDYWTKLNETYSLAEYLDEYESFKTIFKEKLLMEKIRMKLIGQILNFFIIQIRANLNKNMSINKMMIELVQ